jgi:ADP-heptose:LPS heptosyltransferase
MKLLVVSLLRLGDIIQQKPLLEGLRRQFPQAQIHLLINRQFSQASQLLENCVDEFIYFDREALQKGLGEANYNFMWSFTELEKLINQLSAENYTSVYNFTHNRLTAYIIGAMTAQSKKGLYQSEGRFRGLENAWLKYFNERFSGRSLSLFHYVELLGNAFAIPVQKTPARITGKKHKRVLFQVLTSDVKKNWGLENYRQLKFQIEKALVDYRVQVLGAPFEREKLLQVFEEKDLLICNLQDVKDLCSQVDLLVTGDTSIKHLAAQEGLATIEISLGGSDPLKTGAFAVNAQVIASTVACAPCLHSQACPQASHLCGEDVSVDQVFAAVWKSLSQDPQAHVNLERELDRAVWTSFLNGTPQNAPLELRSQLTEKDLARVEQSTADLYSALRRIEAILPTEAATDGNRQLSSLDAAELVSCAQSILRSGQDRAGFFQVYVEALTQKYNLPIQIYNRVNAALTEIRELLRLRESLIQELSTPVLKEGDYYAKGIGQLSIGGFEEAGKSLQRNYEDADL